MTDERKDSEEKIWENLTKDYLTIEQKIDIIREHNMRISDQRWQRTLNALRDYIARH